MESTERKFTVYAGYINNELVYIGSTTQKPNHRFNWHRSNGKKLDFKILQQFDNQEDMLKFEQILLDQRKPRLNKRKTAVCNKKLSSSDLSMRANSNVREWCEKCLRRRVNPGYTKCYWCN